ncbi:CTLH/CRA C-terminal to lish motif domain-containing protein [Neohortaea acidophila]|uniref:CTLH/CRA C-terminal to lish motif domain-containing protein n=1 Tax=Neohortaea acidophila TaxID=245834 RepID=A0A6A6PVE8_9PEZI|nr:CTLH/CRA C-terminal to lish motif domain-containing protein [Neohortaea acidophila]KAF2484100.1 CTLH/CRA C-terminal to lish motif domain-containing protein [Neohortaea acidophila]
MAEFTSSKLDADSHLLLDQPLLRLPTELLRKTLKSAQRQIEMTNKNITSATQSFNPQASPADTLASLDATLAKAQSLKRKLEALHAEEQALHRQQKARINHLQELHSIPTLADVKYDQWSRKRLDRLLVDYLLRQGYTQSAKELAREKNLEELVDIGVFEECGRVERSLIEGRTQECLAWCTDNKQALKKISSNLEVELRLQQFIELARSGDTKHRMDAIVHARKHLANGQDAQFGLRAAGLLAYGPDTLVEPYRTMYSPTRYQTLATLFLQTHHDLFALPTQPLLHIALSAGLSALKTPACHSVHALQPSTLTGAPVCPICSTELNDLARNVPYAHHTKSYMEDDPVVLPNGRVFGRERLRVLNEKLGMKGGRVRDPTEKNGVEWSESEVKKVFIS